MPALRRTIETLGVLVVDDEDGVVAGLRRGLKLLCPQWTIYTATSIRDACNLIKIRWVDIDVVVADHQMPEATGAMLLAALRSDRPQIIRVTLSGALSIADLGQQTRVSDRVLCKPCPAELLRDTIREAYAERFLSG